MKTDYQTSSVSEFLSLWVDKKVVLFEGQRGLVWNATQRTQLIESILNGSGMPPLLVGSLKGNKIRQLLDGQQRTATLLSFKAGKFAIKTNAGNKFYKKLTPAEKKRFDNYMILLEIKEDCTQDELTSLYLKRNSGSPFKLEDKRKAVSGPINTYIYTNRGNAGIQPLVNSRFPREGIKTKSAQLLARHIVLSLLHSGVIPVPQGQTLTDIGTKSLDTLRDEYNASGVKSLSVVAIQFLNEVYSYMNYTDIAKLNSSAAGAVSFFNFVALNIKDFRNCKSAEQLGNFFSALQDHVAAANVDEFPVNGGLDIKKEAERRVTFMNNFLNNNIHMLEEDVPFLV